MSAIKENKAWILEDNAHGYFTWHLSEWTRADVALFSLHKMFPFDKGGSVVIQNQDLYSLCLKGSRQYNRNPYEYHIFQIAKKRKENFIYLSQLLQKYEEVFYSIKQPKDLEENVPQSYPIRVRKGNRDQIYERMNQKGYGVVSLYHTLIEPLRKKEFQEAWDLSKVILNLPLHQDVDRNKYIGMVEELVKACELSESRKKI